jgi:hypothetical protein
LTFYRGIEDFIDRLWMSFYKIIENIKFSIFLKRGYKKKDKKSQNAVIRYGMGG